jgi:hypothetical protein
VPSGPPPEYTDAGSYVGGEVGARRVLDAHGHAFVFKEQPPGLAPATTETLRALGYPAPRYVEWGEDWSIHEELPGSPLGDWRVRLPPRLLELNELQSGRAVDDDRTWPASAIAWTVGGQRDFMFVDLLAAHSDDGRALVARCREAAARAGELPPGRDIVHGDFTAANVLAVGGEITGVIDWGGTCSGDRLFDLATWLYYSPDDVLRTYIVERIGEAGLGVYLAHMAIRQAGWSVRFHAPERGRAMIRYGLEQLRHKGHATPA